MQLQSHRDDHEGSMTDSPISVRCDHCQAIIIHSPRHLTGCLCDPDAPAWVYVTKNGEIRGGSHAKWTQLT